MRGEIHEGVAKIHGRMVEVTEIVLTSTDPVEIERIEMLKARATLWPVEVFPSDRGNAVVRLMRPLRPTALPQPK